MRKETNINVVPRTLLLGEARLLGERIPVRLLFGG
jgi:hypothetical protein